jgi:hypothetical protein
MELRYLVRTKGAKGLIEILILFGSLVTARLPAAVLFVIYSN